MRDHYSTDNDPIAGQANAEAAELALQKIREESYDKGFVDGLRSFLRWRDGAEPAPSARAEHSALLRCRRSLSDYSVP